MFFDGGQRDDQRPGDVLIGGSGGQQAQDFLLTPGEGCSQRRGNRRCLLSQ